MLERRCLLLICVAAVTAACSGASAIDHLQEGKTYAAKRAYREAIIEFRGAVQADPKSGEARLRLADAYMSIDDLPNALREYVRAADMLPNSVEAHLKAGAVLLIAGAFEDAKTHADRVLQLEPQNVAGQLLRGNSLAMVKDLDGAISEFQQAIALDPAQMAAYSNLGSIQISQGKRDEAEATFRSAVAAAPKSISARLALANFLWATERQADAEAVLKEALAIDPANPASNRAIGTFYLLTGRAADAEQYFVQLTRASKTSDARFALSDYYVALKRYDDARRTLRELAEQQDAYGAASVRLAALDAAEGARAQAQTRLHEVLVKDPKNAAASLLSGRLYFLDGDRGKALAAAQAVLDAGAGFQLTAEAHMLAGQVHAANDRRDEAIRSFEEALKLQAQPVDANIALARMHLAGGDGSKGKTYAQQALAMQPDNLDAQALLIRSYVVLGELDPARHALEPLEKKYPRSPTVANLAAAVYAADKRMDAAHASYVKALEMAPDDYEALSGAVRLELAAGRPNEAIARVEGRLARSKPTVETLMLAARAYGAVGNREKMEALLRNAIEADPSALQAYATLGLLYATEERFNEAKKVYGQIISSNPRSVGAHTMMGMLLEKQGRTADAETEYREALAIDPQTPVASNNLAWLLASSNRNLDEALQLAQMAYQKAPGEASFADTLGWTYYQKHFLNEAITYLKEASDKMPKHPVYKFHLGMAYRAAGKFAEARAALNGALALNQDFPGAAEARAAAKAIDFAK